MRSSTPFDLHQAIHAARRSSFLTQSGLAIATGLSRERVRSLESGQAFPEAVEMVVIMAVLIATRDAVDDLRFRFLGEPPRRGSILVQPHEIETAVHELFRDARAELLFEALEAAVAEPAKEKLS